MLNYLFELRRLALHVMFIFFAFFLLFFFFAKELFHGLMLPLLKALPNQDSLIATQISSAVLTPMQLAANAALLATAPFALAQLWRFIAPGLYVHERGNLAAAIFTSLLLFGLGVFFCFFLILPFMFQFFAHALPSGVRLMPDMANALDFITRMLLLFGLCFQLPLFTVLLVRLNWVQLSRLKELRPYVIVGAFIIGMLLTPPDVMSQLMLALPLCLLYELGLFLAAISNCRFLNARTKQLS